jgi:hypothetical protein
VSLLLLMEISIGVPLFASAPEPAAAAGPACTVSGPVGGSYTVELCLATTGGTVVSGDVTVTTSLTPVSGASPAIDQITVRIAGPGFNGEPSVLTDYAAPWSFTLPTARFRDGTYDLKAEVTLADGFKPTWPVVAITFANGVTSAPRSQGSWAPTTGTAGSPFVVAAVGDGAGGLQPAMDVANLIDSWDPNLLLYLGDVYNAGKYTEFYNYYEPTLGRFKPITNPVPGNHEGGGDQFRGYFDYWDSDQHYYAVTAGGWRLIALNSDERFGQYDPGSAQYEWLKQELAANSNPCTLVFFHHPRFSGGGQGDTAAMDPIWQLLVEEGVDIVLTGHDHNYQRWTPLDWNGVAHPDGVTQFVVGTGGHTPFQSVGNDPRISGKASQTSGALRLELGSESAGFQFIGTNGSVLDSGSVGCNDGLGPAPTPTPTATGTNAATPSPTPTLDPGTGGALFADGFESGGLSQWPVNTGLSVQQEIVAGGQFAVRGVSSGSGPAWARASLSQAEVDVVASVDFHVVSKGNNELTLLRLKSGGNGTLLSVHLTPAGRLSYRYVGGSGSVQSDVIPAFGVWHTLEAHFTAGATGQIEIWLDGVRIDALSVSADLGSAPVALVEIGDTASTRTFDVVFDDVRVTVPGVEPDPPTPTPTSTATSTPTETPLPTASATATETPLPTATATGTGTNTPAPTATSTEIASHTPVPTATGTNTPESTATSSPTPSATATEAPVITFDQPTGDGQRWSVQYCLANATATPVEVVLSLDSTISSMFTDYPQTVLPDATSPCGIASLFATNHVENPTAVVVVATVGDNRFESEVIWIHNPMATATATESNTPVSTSTPMATSTSLPTGPLVLTPAADARVEERSPTTNFGAAATLIVDRSPMTETYLRFDISGLSGPAQSATLRLWVVDPASNAPPVSLCASSVWDETTITWANKPGANGALDDKGAVTSGVWLEYDVTPWIAGSGGVCFALIPQSSNGLDLGSRESANPPQLVITGETATPPTVTPELTVPATSTPDPTPTWTETVPPSVTPALTVPPTSTSTPTVTSTSTNTPEPTASQTETTVPSGDILFNDGFESGDLGLWPTNSGVVMQQNVVATGSLAARATSNGDGPAYARGHLRTSESEVYASIRFNVVSKSPTNELTLMRLTTGGNTPIITVYLTPAGRLSYRRIGSSSSVKSAVTVTEGTWHVLEVRLLVNGDSGESEIWLDGVRIVPLSVTLNFGTSSIARIEIGDSSRTRTFDLAVDDVTVSTAPIAMTAVAGFRQAAPTATVAATQTITPTPSPTETATVTPTITAVPTVAPTETPTQEPTAAIEPSPTATEPPTDVPTPSETVEPEVTPTEPVVQTATPHPVAQTSRSASTVSGTFAVDSDPGTVWQTADGEDPGSLAILTLDLGEVVPVESVLLLPGSNGLLGTATIETSVDGDVWSHFASPDPEAIDQNGWLRVSPDPAGSGPVTARYVRIVFSNPGDYPTLGGLAEIEVWPPDTSL